MVVREQGPQRVADSERARPERRVLQNTKLRVALRRLERKLVAAEEVHRLGTEPGAAGTIAGKSAALFSD